VDAVGLRNILELGSWSQKLRSPGRIGPSSQRFYSWPCPISLSPLRGDRGFESPSLHRRVSNELSSGCRCRARASSLRRPTSP
jgi:hypothetical protein